MDFHISAANAAFNMIEYATSKTDIRNVVISGGVFMNQILSNLLRTKLSEKKLTLFENCIIPPNDGGISFGQAIAASYLFKL